MSECQLRPHQIVMTVRDLERSIAFYEQFGFNLAGRISKPDGRNRAAVLYSLLNTCKLNNIDPWAWLKDVIVKLADRDKLVLKDLLPHRWKPAL